MNTMPSFRKISLAALPGKRFFAFLAMCCLAFSLAACGSTGPTDVKTGKKPGQPGNPDERKLAYGVSINIPATWKVPNAVTADAANNSGLDERRKKGERILLLEAAGEPSSRNIEPMIGVFLVNEQGTFMPREYAERLTPEEFVNISKDLLEREKAAAKKEKKPTQLLDLQVSRDNIGGRLAILQRLLVNGPDGKPVRLMNWDIYLPGNEGAGIAVKTICDQSDVNAEGQLTSVVKSIRVPGAESKPAAKQPAKK